MDKSNTEILTLTSGLSRCEILPGVGGSVGSWAVDGQPMLRAASAASIAEADPFGTASFPLVPYSNRIGGGRFEWDGRVIALARNSPPEPHSIHGVGFARPWSVQSQETDRVVLEMVHRPGVGWPWPFKAQQQISLDDRLLTIELNAINLSDRAVPLAFGHHPYFPRDGASLNFRAQGVWLVGDDGLPSVLIQPSDKFDFSQPKSVDRLAIDHCFIGWNGSAHIAWRKKSWALEITASEELPNTVVCIRDDLDGFCFEPVPHVNDALNRRHNQTAMPIVEPGAAFRASIRFRAAPV
jgi:aldose 1-epimerase